MLYLARILYPVRVLGPGERVGVWLCGCSHRCFGCSNPELWERQDKYLVSNETALRLIRSVCENNRVDGFTITGGDPFEQPQALSELLPELKKLSGDILAYTGFTREQLYSMKNLYVNKSLEYISVLIDGLYVEESNSGSPLRGSDNQRIIYLDESVKPFYEAYISQGNKIQNFTIGGSVVSVGIHTPDYQAALSGRLFEKNLIPASEEENRHE